MLGPSSTCLIAFSSDLRTAVMTMPSPPELDVNVLQTRRADIDDGDTATVDHLDRTLKGPR